MPYNNDQLASNLTEIIRESVKTTIATLFNVSIDANTAAPLVPSGEDFVCCGELIQDGTSAKLMFIFDRDLIEKLVNMAFASAGPIDPEMYEATALEIVNIVGNNLKMYLNVHGYRMQMLIPYTPKRLVALPNEPPMVHLAFSLKNSAVMGVDFYLRRA